MTDGARRAQHGAMAPTELTVALAEEPFDRGDGARLVAALNADIERRYAGIPDDGGPPPVPEGARPAPRAAPRGDPRWAVTSDEVERPRGTFVVARVGGEAVACGALRPLPGGEPGVAEVKRLWVEPSARRLGLARRVLARLVEAARELGYRQVVLETGTQQPEALALYVAEGWYPVVSYGEYCGAEDSRSFGLDLRPDGAPTA